jgi:Tfp pilus assembly protein PilZ
VGQLEKEGRKMIKKENRSLPRVKVRWPVTVFGPLAQTKGEIQNVSSKGAFVTCKDMPPLDGDFYVVIETSDLKTRCITGEVVWSTIAETSTGASNIGVGVSFKNMSRNDRQFLHKIIAKQYAKKTGGKIDKR